MRSRTKTACFDHFAAVRIKEIALLVIVSLIGISAAAQSNTKFEPASFPDDGADLIAKTKFPKVSGAMLVAVNCIADVNSKGYAGRAYCFHNSNEESHKHFARSVRTATKNLRINPARVDGVAVGVRLNFSFQFAQIGDIKRISVFPNHQRYSVFYGNNYSAPQRYAENFDSVLYSAQELRLNNDARGVRDFAKRDLKMKCGDVKKLTVHVRVSSVGAPLVANTISADGSSACETLAMDDPEANRYIPAMRDGVPFAALFFENYIWSPYRNKHIYQ